jgi:Carboxypeptidase regulatory-like domain/TonB-dependent Receptor Plug Domain
MHRLTLYVMAAALFSASLLCGQQISGSINGVVKDAQQAAVGGAKVTISNLDQGTSRTVVTATDGSFVVTQIQPGSYTVSVEATGFKKFENKDVRVFANDRLSLGDIVLSLGAVNETVTVEAQGDTVQTSSAERAGVLTGRQVTELAENGRSLFDLTRVLPGVVYTGGLGGIQANGNRGNQNNFTLDGVTNVDTGSNGGTLATTNIDMIAEMKVITNSQPAEFGRSSGAQIEVVTKGGTKDFHGTGYFFHRHEDLNANTWRNNVDGRQKDYYRYNTAGFNVGGPAYIPGKLNRNKDKLFFFVGLEWQKQLVPQGLHNVTVPTAAERNGDFSQTHDAGGAPVTILDPANGKVPFPGNIVPKSRFNPDGYKILNWYPQPNALGIDPSYNFQTSDSNTYPRREEIYRGDYNINDKWKAYARFIRNADETSMAYGQWNASYNIPFGPMSFGAPGWSFVSNVTTIINPTLTNEFVFGSSRNDLHITPITDAFNASKVGVSYTMPFPNADKLKLVQNWNFGGVPNAPTTGFAGTPFLNFNHTYDITDSVAKVHDTHTMKAGIYLHKSLKDQTAFTSVNGIINFDRDANNPNDANWAFANALLGNYDTLQQSSEVLNGQYRSWNVEWYLQDNWRATSKLTLEYGMRFYWVQPQYDQALQTSAWNPGLYNTANTAVLRTAGLDASGKRVSINPLTGEQGPAALIGSIVNTGKGFVNGVYANGMGQAGKNGYPKGLMADRGILYAPRLGIAYQLDSKTVVRAGGGVFYDRLQGNPVFDMLPNPPSTIIPKFYYGNLASIPPASAGTFFPAGVVGFDEGGNIPTTYNWNFTIQRQLPFDLLLDVGYVGSSSNHDLYRVNQDAIPLGAAWLPQNQDPLNSSPKFDGTTSNQPNFYRPYLGYAGTTDYGFGANSNYHALQVAAHRRFGRSFTFDGAYTWSKVLGTASGDGSTVNPFNSRAADYGPLSYDHTQVLVFNYVYNLPTFVKSKSAFGRIGGGIANDWQISGITTFQTGAPVTPSFTISGIGNLNERYTGSPDIGPRVAMTGSPSYPKGIYQWMNPTTFALPPVKGSAGFDSAPDSLRLPGDNDWDISIFKNIPLPREGMHIQLRVEMFNAFNHARFNAVNTSAQFNPSGQLINTPSVLGGTGGRFGFGALTGTADPRRIQLAAKFYF